MVAKEQSLNGGSKRFVIYLGSTTPEKLRDLQRICEHKRWPIYFRDIKELVDAFRSSAEVTGKIEGNAIDKLKKLQGSVIPMLSDSEKILREKCEEYGIPYDPARIFFATEDGGFRVPKEVWDKMDKEGIPDTLLDLIRKNKESKGAGPYVETAGVLSAVFGPQNLMKRLIKAARDLGIEPHKVQVNTKTILRLRSFKQDSRPDITAEGETTNYLYDPGDIRADARRISTMDYLRPRDHPGQSIAQDPELYVTEYSERARMIGDLASKLGLGAIDHVDHPKKGLKTSPPLPFKIGLLPPSPNAEPHASIHRHLKKGGGDRFNIINFPPANEVPGQRQTTRSLLGGIESVVEPSDGFILLPDEVVDQTKEMKFEKFYTLFSLIVAKQLVARDMSKPIVILNHDGSWDDVIANHIALVNLGMTKDYNLSWPERIESLPKGASIESNSYFDVIRANNYEDSLQAGLQLLRKKRENYQRRQSSDDQEYEDGIKPEETDCFKVAVFCSACNQNERLNANVKELSYHLVKEGFGVIYGAGDRYTMGAVLEGVKDYRQELIKDGLPKEEANKRAWIGGISTVPILVSETEGGKFSPDLSYYKQTKNIYNRMADMLDHSDALVVAPGGAGTVMEKVAPLMIKKLAPELFMPRYHTPGNDGNIKAKPIVIYNPSLFSRNHGFPEHQEQKVWDLALKSLLGNDYQLLTSVSLSAEENARREQRCQELGIYVETELEQVKKRLESFRKKWTTDKATWTRG